MNGFAFFRFRPMPALLGAAALAVLMPGGIASAQSGGMTYPAARAAGLVGEQVDGYLGFPSPPSTEVRRLADEVNIKRRAIYADRAAATHATIEEYAFSTACQLILKVKPGEWYQAPDGSWQQRAGSLPVRDQRCAAPAS